jgi:hypothetical protein
LASSGADRLRPVGIFVNAEIEVANWFLNDRQDVRSSFALEGVATEFDIQGLELDWAAVGGCRSKIFMTTGILRHSKE